MACPTALNPNPGVPGSGVPSSGVPNTVYLKDYQAPPYLIDETQLHFDIYDEGPEGGMTKVTARLKLGRNPGLTDTEPNLVLNGSPDMVTRSVTIDGRELGSNEFSIDQERLVIFDPPDTFELSTQVEIRPQDNTALEGLYKSGGIYTTQCEAEGFRNITWYLDRPDVMSRFTTTIVAHQASCPVLLSNGNEVSRGTKGDRHWVTWEDPFKKPSYLFALVAGDLQHIEDEFITRSGRRVTLRIFTEAHNIDKVDYAMRCLQQAMAWDEKTYGREYDLDIFMIVAVESFNMGAMENKGLNLFNTACVLASPETTTDEAYQGVDSTVSHEYFHNWSGNRVTCRDWFQLSLKEGFTVFRDQQYSADAGSPGVSRVQHVLMLRSAQFPEDAGPLAHPIRPESYIEINNFYTATVYEKGAEVVRMLHTLVGKEQFRKGTDLYFARHDGQAVTTEEFVKAIEAATGTDLEQFRLWYRQAGTPLLKVASDYDAAAQSFTLSLSQSCPPSPGQEKKAPYHLPFAVGLLDASGKDMLLDIGGLDLSSVDTSSKHCTLVLNLRQPVQKYVFKGVATRPVPSLLRGFSAPVKLEYAYSRDDLLFLMRHDSDDFNRWEAGQRLAVEILQDLSSGIETAAEAPLDERLLTAFEALLNEAIERDQEHSFDKQMLAHMLRLPAESHLVDLAQVADIDAIHGAINQARHTIAKQLQGQLLAVYKLNQDTEPDQDSQSVAQRALKNVALEYLMHPQDTEMTPLCFEQFQHANNMTDTRAALRALVNARAPAAQVPKATALADFYDRWVDQALVIDAWFAVQASCRLPDTLETVKQLEQHAAFDLNVPNRMRALIGAFAGQNLINFHHGAGAGYAFLADQVLALDALNPQMAARMLTPLTRWQKYDAARQVLMKQQLSRILELEKLSNNVFEVASRSVRVH